MGIEKPHLTYCEAVCVHEKVAIADFECPLYYTYDSENLMVHLVHGTADGRNVSVYTYDKDGREIRTRMGSRIRTTEYDSLG